MNNLLLRVSLKYGLILFALNLLFGMILYMLTNQDFLPENGAEILIWLLPFIVVAYAHFDYNKRNENFISVKAAILIGLIIVGSSYIIISAFYTFFFDPNPNELYYDLLSTSALIQLWFIGLLVQILLLFILITAESIWIIFTKAGKEGWASIIPLYNLIVLLEIVKKPTWWIFLLLFPIVNIVFVIWVTNLLAKRFNKDESFTLGLLLLPFIFYPLWGMSRAEYNTE